MDGEITPTPNGPLHAQHIKALKNHRDETIDTGETIFLRPSGALLYKLRGKRVQEYFTETAVRVEKDGPLHVHRAKLNGEAQPATEDHYALCRCGASRNKPFCDGMHARIKFRDGSGE